MRTNPTHFYCKHALVLLLCLFVSISTMQAVPAWSGWQTKSQPDGTKIVVRQLGDEFYHYWETEDGKLAIEQADGTFIVSDKPLPTSSQVAARRNASAMYKSKPRKTIGERNFAPKGLVILVQFSDVKFQEKNDVTAFNNLLNQEGYYEGGATGSAKDYFKAQSNGKYSPKFEVFGPVTLANTRKYYGEEGNIAGLDANDMYMADFVIDATKAADAAGCDFTQYDSDNDGKVDIVYFFYAGLGQASGGESETIWPHNWELQYALLYKRTHGTTYSYTNPLKLDGKMINNYACSAELKNDGTRSGIGTLCHEFSHVLGLPDYYDTSPYTPNNTELHNTPWEWSIMDYGSYNNNEMTPPNYSIFDKYFMGWATPKFLEANVATGVAITTDYDDAYQITGGSELVPYTNEGTVYYIENRQQKGWDAALPYHGMLLWKVRYNATAWLNNGPNNEISEPRYTLVPSSGGFIVGEAD